VRCRRTKRRPSGSASVPATLDVDNRRAAGATRVVAPSTAAAERRRGGAKPRASSSALEAATTGAPTSDVRSPRMNRGGGDVPDGARKLAATRPRPTRMLACPEPLVTRPSRSRPRSTIASPSRSHTGRGSGGRHARAAITAPVETAVGAAMRAGDGGCGALNAETAALGAGVEAAAAGPAALLSPSTASLPASSPSVSPATFVAAAAVVYRCSA
jgi:hypothetical protein